MASKIPDTDLRESNRELRMALDECQAALKRCEKTIRDTRQDNQRESSNDG